MRFKAREARRACSEAVIFVYRQYHFVNSRLRSHGLSAPASAVDVIQDMPCHRADVLQLAKVRRPHSQWQIMAAK
jgi:hypothetical protein